MRFLGWKIRSVAMIFEEVDHLLPKESFSFRFIIKFLTKFCTRKSIGCHQLNTAKFNERKKKRCRCRYVE